MQFKGKVIKGTGYGKKLGFPTANIDRRDFYRRKLKLREGIYAGLVERERNGKKYKAGIVIGPKDKKGLLKLEAYILGLKEDIYGERLVFYPLAYIRAFKHYKSEAELKKAIREDVRKIKKSLL
ncbi:MAG: riboflavin kinase [bacterium]|nr:riboflavin kinase [bacterium]